jgi:probable HAF family extracellular repeat protein
MTALPGGTPSGAWAVADNAQVVAGYVTASDGTREAVIWTSTAVVRLGSLSTASSRSDARGVSSDGTVVVGGSDTPSGVRPFCWDATNGMINLGMLPGFWGGHATHVSNTRVVLGVVWSDAFDNFTPFIWDPANGMQRLDDVLALCGVPTTEERPVSAGPFSSQGLLLAYSAGECYLLELPTPVPTVPAGRRLDRLADMVVDLNLANGISNSLDAKLDAVLDALEDAVDGNETAASNMLYAFMSAVEAQAGHQVPEEEADWLIADALTIIELLESP